MCTGFLAFTGSPSDGVRVTLCSACESLSPWLFASPCDYSLTFVWLAPTVLTCALPVFHPVQVAQLVVLEPVPGSTTNLTAVVELHGLGDGFHDVEVGFIWPGQD